MKVRVISGSHSGLKGEIKHSLAERLSTLGKDGKVTLYFKRRGKENTISIRVKHLQEELDLFDSYKDFNSRMGHFP